MALTSNLCNWLCAMQNPVTKRDKVWDYSKFNTTLNTNSTEPKTKLHADLLANNNMFYMSIVRLDVNSLTATGCTKDKHRSFVVTDEKQEDQTRGIAKLQDPSQAVTQLLIKLTLTMDSIKTHEEMRTSRTVRHWWPDEANELIYMNCFIYCVMLQVFICYCSYIKCLWYMFCVCVCVCVLFICIIQCNWPCLTWKSTIEIKSLLLLLLLLLLQSQKGNCLLRAVLWCMKLTIDPHVHSQCAITVRQTSS